MLAGIKEIKEVMAAAEQSRRQMNRRTIVFVDEIHRFNKSQQDAFLPRVEAGDIVLIGATTENPSFEVNAALLSRSKVYTLRGLTEDEIVAILERALHDTERGLGEEPIDVEDGVLQAIARFSNGDAQGRIEPARADDCCGAARGGWIDAHARAWRPCSSRCSGGRCSTTRAARSTTTSCRRCISRCATAIPTRRCTGWRACSRRAKIRSTSPGGSSDSRPKISAMPIPQALTVAVAAKDAVHFIGMPEGNTALAQAAIYLATAPKSNAVYVAYNEAAEDAVRQIAEPVPLHIRNAPTKLMKELDYGKGYKYAHDEAEGVADMDCLPPSLAARPTIGRPGADSKTLFVNGFRKWKQLRKKT